MAGVTRAKVTAEMSVGTGHCARAELAAALGQTEEVALPWGWHGRLYCSL